VRLAVHRGPPPRSSPGSPPCPGSAHTVTTRPSAA
jgi:hypothetical protein